MRSLIFLMIAVLCNPCFAQLKLQISGPTSGQTGDLVVINSTGSEAVASSWIVPKELDGKTLLGCSDQLAFATRDPGSYTFFLYGTDGEKLAHTTHTVTIKGVKPTDPVPPVDPVDPVDPPPVGNFDDLKKKSRDLSLQLNDTSTRTLLGQNLSQNSFGDTLLAAQKSVELIFTQTMAKRTRGSQDSDWYNQWYVPILKEIQSLNQAKRVVNVNDYHAAMRAVSDGLLN